MIAYDHAYEHEVLEYFKRKADQYDLVDEQVYWNLSDRLLASVFEEHVLRALPASFDFLDAGGGTGRWTALLLRTRPEARGLLYDLSPEMSAKALEKGAAEGFADRLTVKNGRLEKVEHELAGRRFDLIFNFHNVLGFVQDVPDVVRQLAGLLAPGGLFVSFVPNRYHTMFFNIFVGNLEEAEHTFETGQGRFTTDMPYMNLFTPAGMAELYREAGLEPLLTTGFPNLIYPGFQETQLRGSSSVLQGLLQQGDNFERIYRLEREVLNEPGIAARGNNLFVLGRKVSGQGRSDG
jgi:SAM-dependent methyltransferase